MSFARGLLNGLRAVEVCIIVLRTIAIALSLLALAVGLTFLGYQRPVSATVTLGGPFSQSFLDSSAALDQAATDQGYLYADELDEDGERSRWTRQRAELWFNGLGESPGALTLEVRARGWPADTVGASERQPDVRVSAGGQPIGSFTPRDVWQTYTLTIPAELASSNLRLTFESSSTFAQTTRYPGDKRPKGVRLRSLGLTAVAPPGLPRLPDSDVLLGAIVVTLLAYWLLRQLGLMHFEALLFTMFFPGGLAMLIAFGRPWVLPVLAVLQVLLLACGALALLPRIAYYYRALVLRFDERNILPGSMLVASFLAMVLLIVPPLLATPPVDTEGLASRDPEALVQGLLVVSLLLISIFNVGGMSRAVSWIRRKLMVGPGLPILFVVMMVGWTAYAFSIIQSLPFVGHADYADNAVVARNLLEGRGWVVDYVTQFYKLNPGGSLTRAQETWPLMQPVWILPFFKLFGAQAWAAKIPNVIFTALLALGVYFLALRLWDRRVAFVAVLLTLSNYYIFLMVMYTTSDLGLVLFSFCALTCFFLSQERRFGNEVNRPRLLLLSGIFTGLMLLQKPATGLMFGLGMLLWWLYYRRTMAVREWRVLALRWMLPAVLLFTPYVGRNLLTFGAPFHSSESRDAWVIGYTSFESIYKVYTQEGGLGGPGVPNRSWLLQWGYEQTFSKIRTQASAVRDYLLPPLEVLGPLGGRGEMLGAVGTWLALAGMFGRWGRRRGSGRLITLVLFAMLPYLLLLIFYWHADEERYFRPLIPWLALFAGVAIIGIFDLISRGWEGRLAIIGVIFAGVLLFKAAQPGWLRTDAKINQDQALWQLDLQAFDWLRQNTQPDEVVMTRVPWQLNFHAARPALMTPNTRDLQQTLRLARYYGADYLLVNAIQNEKEEAREALKPLLEGQEASGFTRVQSFTAGDRSIYIYRFPSNYGGVSEIKLP